VQGLSKSERRYFNLNGLQHEGDRYTAALYQLISGANGSEENSLAKAFRKKFPKASYDSARKHLYKILMRSLRSYESEKSTERRLLNTIADARILFNKGLPDLAFKEIERGKMLAQNSEQFMYYLLLAKIELQYLSVLGFPAIDEINLVEKQERVNDMLYRELFINRHASLYELLLHRYIHQGGTRSEGAVEKLNDLVLEEFQVSANVRYQTSQSEKLHLHFQSVYFLMTGEPDQALNEYYKLEALFSKNESRDDEDQIYYIYLLYGLLTCLHFLRKYDEMERFMHKLENIKVSSSGLFNLSAHLAYQFRLAVLNDQKDYVSAEVLIKQSKSKGVLNLPVSPNIRANTLIHSSITFFGLKDYHSALNLINEILALDARYLSATTIVLARLLFLLTHLEIGNDDYLVYAVRSLERKLKSDNELFKLEKTIIDFVKRWINADQHKRNDLLSALHNDLHSISHDKYALQLLLDFDFAAWCRAKLGQK
jgi:hypothetical protein